jgi:hypothetical protein
MDQLMDWFGDNQIAGWAIIGVAMVAMFWLVGRNLW